MRLPLFIASLVLLWGVSAFADRIPPPPPDCPAGSTGATGHEGEHCVPLDCKADSDCKGGLVCREFPLCTEEKMLSPGRSPVESLYIFVEGTCEDPSSCRAPATCKGGKRCVKPSSGQKAPAASGPVTLAAEKPPTPGVTKPPTTGKAGGCAVSSPASPGVLFGVLGVLGLVLLRRRR